MFYDIMRVGMVSLPIMFGIMVTGLRDMTFTTLLRSLIDTMMCTWFHLINAGVILPEFS